MEKLKTWFKENKKKGYIYIGCAFAVVVIIASVVTISINAMENVVVRQTEIVAEVNLELDKQVETYLEGVKHPDEAKINFDTVDITKLGDYEGTIQYKDETYIFKFTVKDTVKPIIVAAKESYTFPLDTHINDVNETINADLKITDNYDKEFEPIQVVTEIPESESELDIAISIKDTSENESDKVTIKVQFTENGEEKADLEKVETSANKPYVPQPKVETPKVDEPTPDVPSSGNNGSNGNSGNNSNSSSNGGTGSVTPTPKPQPEPTPQPDPTPQPEPTPPAQPSTPEYTTPAGAVDGGVFDTKEQANAWLEKMTADSNSQYYGWRGKGRKLQNGQWNAYIFQN